MKTQISFSDFTKLDIRIGAITAAEVPEWSHWVMKLTVDLGAEIGKKIVFAGIMKFYQPEELIGRQFAFVVNLEPKKIGPKEKDGRQNYSQAMMLMALTGAETKPILLSPWEKVENGAEIG